MKIPAIQNLINTDLLAKSPQAVVDAWKVGQLVNASAVSSQTNGQATVNINGALMLAQTQFPLKSGQPLRLEVTSLTALTVLKLIATSNVQPGNAPPITVSLPAQPQLLGQLQAGQQLSATLARPEASNPLRTVLELASNRVSVQLSQALPSTVGQQVKLEVVSPGAIAALKILSTTANAASDASTISQALRSTLPQQAPLAPLLANLALIAKDRAPPVLPGTATPQTLTTAQRTPQAPTLPQPLVELVRSVVEGLPRRESINTADGLKQAVAQSGVFMEAKLAQALLQPGTTAPPIDFKGGLLSLLLTLLNVNKSKPLPTPGMPNAVAQTPAGAHASMNLQMTLQQALSELLRSVESGLARVKLSQLVTSTPEEDGKRTWLVELPVRSGEHIDLVQLRVERDKSQAKSAKEVLWTVTLKLELSGLGPVEARVSLRDKTVSTNFWAEHAPTSELIKQHLEILQMRYREVGLTVGSINAHHGKAPEPVAADAHLPHILLDEKA
jgi:Flagellar hook-length control protein FliK